MTCKHVLIAGGSGVVGQAVIKAFEKTNWKITTLNRGIKSPSHNNHISVDLLSSKNLKEKHRFFKNITHLFYAALKPNNDPGIEADENAMMLENLVTALRQADAPLERIIFIQGGKVYGAHLGVYKTPAREDDSRHFPPNLYFRHEDYVRSLEKEGMKWTALRPDIVIGHSLGSSMNLGNLIGVYGTLCKITNTSMQFPGNDFSYRNTLVNITSAKVLGDASLWVTEKNMNGAFNITNGDIFRWSHVWPKLANWFGVEIGEPQPISLAQRLTALQPIWKQIASDYNLIESNLERIALGSFGDFIFHVQNDAIFDVTKARKKGFTSMNEYSDDVLLAHLEGMRAKKLIP